MIEAIQPWAGQPYRIFLNNIPLCEVLPTLDTQGNIDWDASKLFADQLAKIIKTGFEHLR